MLSKEIQGAIEMLRKDKAASKGQVLTPEVGLEVRNRIDGILGSLPVSDRISSENVSEGAVEGVFFRYDGTDPEKLRNKVLLFLHGGGFINGSVKSRRKLCNDIMEQAKIDAFSVEYGQWPEHKHPKALEDCVASYRWLLSKGYESRNIYVFGESAGAMLIFTLLLYLKDHGDKLPGKALAFSPVAGQEIELPSHTELDARDPMISYDSVVPYYEDSDFKSPYVSPAYGDFTGFPRIAIHVGSEEVLLDDAKLLYDKCTEAGAEASLRVWDGLFHVFPLFDSPETAEALTEIGDFFRND